MCPKQQQQATTSKRDQRLPEPGLVLCPGMVGHPLTCGVVGVPLAIDGAGFCGFTSTFDAPPPPLPYCTVGGPI